MKAFGPASAGAAGWLDGSGGAFLCRDDRHRSRYASECFGSCLCRSTRAGCWRGLHGLGQEISHAGIVFDGDEGRLGEEAFLRDFAGDLPEAKAKVLYAVQEPFQKALLMARLGGGAVSK